MSTDTAAVREYISKLEVPTFKAVDLPKSKQIWQILARLEKLGEIEVVDEAPSIRKPCKVYKRISVPTFDTNALVKAW